ncbi:MAG: sensor histidine kinase [Planctomycetota bacterium]
MSRWRPAILAAVILAVSLAHYLTPTGEHGSHALHAFYRWFYHLPIILAAFWYGIRGGMAACGAVTGLYLPHVLFQWHGGSADQWLEIVLYNLVGIVTGVLSQRQRNSFAALKEKTQVLVETEEQLRAADRLAALGQLSAGLAHEVKTPLASIRGAAEILGSGTAKDVEQKEFSEILLREVDRLNRVVIRFLDFARPTEDESRDADLGSAVDEILNLVRLEAAREKVEVETDLADGLPRVKVDPEQLKQVILNLVMNALQAMENGGTLEVTTKLASGKVQLTVADTGEGIPDEIRDRVLDPFYTTRPRGTGLGLSIVQKILLNHGAELDLRRREPGGTMAVVTFQAGEVANG